MHGENMKLAIDDVDNNFWICSFYRLCDLDRISRIKIFTTGL